MDVGLGGDCMFAVFEAQAHSSKSKKTVKPRKCRGLIQLPPGLREKQHAKHSGAKVRYPGEPLHPRRARAVLS